MRKTKLILSLLLLTSMSWAATTIYPTADRLCRNGSSTTWIKIGETMTPVDPSESFTTFELKYQSKLYAILQFEVPNFKAVKTMSFVFTKDDVANLATKMGVWNYSGYDMPQNNGTSATYTYQKATEVTGVEPGSTDETNLKEPLAQGDNKDGVWTFAIDANAIAPTVVYKEDGTTAVVQLLLTTYNPATRTNASKIFGYNADPTKMPHLDVEYVDYSKPVLEICYRTKSDNTGWNSGSYPMHAASTNNFEITHSSGLCAVYQYWLEDFDKSMNYTFTITKRDQETNVYAWEFPYALPQKNSDPAAEFAANVETVTGVALGTAKDAGTYNETYLAISDRKNGVATFTIKGSDLKNVVTDARGNKIVTLLLTSQLGGNYKYYNSLSNTSDVNKPSWTIASYANVYNETQDLTYDDLPAACTGAVDGDVIRVNNDVTLTARLGVDKALTIKGRTPQTKILRGTDLNNLLILSQKDVTLKNITLDGQSVSREKDGIECGTNKLTLDNVTMQNFVPTNGKADVCVNGNGVILTNTNILPNGIRLNKKKRVQTTNATHTEPILLLLAGDYEEEYSIVLTCSSPSLFTAKDANGNDWYLYDTQSGSNHELKGKKYKSAITLDESLLTNEDTLALYNGRTVDITLTRTIAGSASDYSTLCLPFETTQAELGAEEVLAYDHASISGDAAVLTFVPVTDLEAGKPYLVRFALDKTNTVFTGKTITAATPGKYGDGNYEFVGLFSQTQITTEQTQSMMYLGGANTLYWAGDNCTIKGSRGYIKAVSAPAQAARRVALYNAEAQSPTGNSSLHHSINSSFKMIRDGQFVITREGKEYNVLGY